MTETPAPPQPAEKGIVFGRVRLNPGIGRLNMTAFYFSAFATICLLSFSNVIQPYLLTEILGVPLAEQGSATGDLLFWYEVVIILTIGLAGSLSDKVGRRAIVVASFLIIGMGYVLMIQAQSLTQLILFRMFFALGAAGATAMLSTVLADYVVDRDRGKANGLSGVMNGLGAIVAVFVLLNLPRWLLDGGMDSLRAGQYTYYFVGGLAVLTAILLGVGLSRRRPSQQGQPAKFFELLRTGVLAARDPGVLLGYSAAFVSRGDLAIVGTFLALWINKHGVNTGLEAAQVLAQTGIIVGISQMAAFLGAPIFGIMADRMNRATFLAITNIVSGIGYCSLFLVGDPFTGAMIAAVVVAGAGNIGTVIATQVLIQQQAPPAIRGSVIGFFSLSGAVGILVATKVGGWLFDFWSESGPFVLFGALSFGLAIWALAIRGRVKPVVQEVE